MRTKYQSLRTESPGDHSEGNGNGFVPFLQEKPSAPWSEAGERCYTDQDESIGSEAELALREQAQAESSFDKIATQIRSVNKPLEILRSSITNSLLLFRMALGLTQDATMSSCFEVLKEAATSGSVTLELVNTSDGPHKLTIENGSWEELPDDIQAAIKHFNSLVSLCHKFLGSRELKMADISLKLEDLQLLPLTKEKEKERQALHDIPVQIDKFTEEIGKLFETISTAGKILEYVPNITL